MSTQETYLKGIADAIREKTGETGTIKAAEFADKIAYISAGVEKPSWKLATGLTDGSWQWLTYGAGIFLALQATRIARSVDGKNWTQYAAPFSSGYGRIRYCKDRFFLLVQNSATGYYSYDGLSWSAFSLPTSKQWTDITYGSNKFVATCQNSYDIAYSTDGESWTLLTSKSANSWLYSICYGRDRFVAVGSSTTFMYSTDGVSWNSGTLPVGGSWNKVAYLKDRFIAINFNLEKIVYSYDGITWQSIDADKSLEGICYGANKFVYSGYRHVAYSVDGITWTPCTVIPSLKFYEIAYGMGVFVVVNIDNGGIYYLEDFFSEWAE